MILIYYHTTNRVKKLKQMKKRPRRFDFVVFFKNRYGLEFQAETAFRNTGREPVAEFTYTPFGSFL